MDLTHRINNLSQIGRFLGEFLSDDFVTNSAISFPKDFYLELKNITESHFHHNNWFTQENIIYALKQWKELLNKENLRHWVSAYDLQDVKSVKKIGIIMAGNIPMVGFHDLLCVLICGYNVKIKLSSKDSLLIPFFIRLLSHVVPKWASSIKIVENQLVGFDAIIATGSNNTSRYFSHYFGKYPHIIRKNRISVAVLKGDESVKDLRALAEDVFRYFGLGCRNVSKIFIPEDFDLNRLFKVFYTFKEVVNHHKYKNNYDYHKAIFLMNRDKIIENGFIILKEDKSLYSPIGTLFYERYNDISVVKERLQREKENIQCVVNHSLIGGGIAFGETQKPILSQYADGIDTLNFLKALA